MNGDKTNLQHRPLIGKYWLQTPRNKTIKLSTDLLSIPRCPYV